MKQSGIDWIGEIPDDWKIEKAKHVFRQRFDKGNELTLQLLSPTQKFGVIPQTLYEELTTYSAVKLKEGTDLSTFKTVHKGDFCISLRSFQGGFEYSRYEGVVSPAYQIFYAIKKIDDEYYKYLFKDQTFIAKMNSYTMSLRDGKNIAFSDFGDTFIPLPPKATQQRIAEYLDSKCAQIDSIIEESKKSIEEYKAWKQSVIFEAVTGKNLNCKKKDSGIEWIGEIPEGWEVKRFKFVATSLEKGAGITKEEVFEDGDTPCVRYGEIYSKYNQSFSNCISKTFNSKIPVQKYFTNGDILFVGTGELVEEIGKCIAYLGNENCLAGGDIIIAKHKQNPSFLSYAMNSSYAQNQKSRNKAKLKVVHISATEIGDVQIFLPPIHEQEAIAKMLDSKCAQIDSLIAEKESLIADLTEYKKSLIFEVVTGKRSV